MVPRWCLAAAPTDFDRDFSKSVPAWLSGIGDSGLSILPAGESMGEGSS